MSFGLLRWLAGRVALTIVLLVIASMLVWGGVHALAGDPVSAVLGVSASPEQITALRRELGLDRPLHEQYLTWFVGVVHGDLGTSLVSRSELTPLVLDRLRASAAIAAWAAAAVLLVFLPLGVLAGAKPGGGSHTLVTIASVLAAIPEFVIGATLLGILAVRLQWLPSLSIIRAGEDPWLEPRLVALPALTITFAVGGWCIRLVRGVVAAQLHGPTADAARTVGMPEHWVLRRCVLPQAIAPIVQSMGWLTAGLVGAGVVGEQLVGYSGIGSLLVSSARFRDLPAVAGIALALALIVSVALLLSDLIAGALDPRLRPWR